ncbi:lipocalin-like domain-containing protein [Acidovorax sp. Root217]|uniref:lipocalin-like domain-containing protein n=1 Tax=Acidovorax sp. Root217 TaxID=1736492 RepID=UPI0009EB393B|nr:carotenoid 1,2-hydratase [Acidovorax sp. Root217]
MPPYPMLFGVPPAPSRRKALVLGLAGALGSAWSGHAQALPARTLAFPRDHGSHSEQRTEWWYITGHAQAGGREWGFQVTFFRSRVDVAQGIRSTFAAKQLLFAHAALTDLKGQRLHHDQRIARAGFGVAQASESDTAIRLQDWSLVRSDLPGGGGGRYTARIQGEHFGLQLQFDATQPVLLQGREGLSRKGPESTQASYYYSQPQLAVGGAIVLDGKRMAIAPGSGRAWMDHEWSEALLHPEAQGWDWIGMNLLDGSALTAFRLRRADGSALWAGGSFRAPGQAARVFDAAEVVFTPERWWTSPVSGARYPVQWRVQTPVGVFLVRSLLDDQELDSSASTGAIYWEGLSELVREGTVVGKGYLEMTGYANTLKL